MNLVASIKNIRPRRPLMTISIVAIFLVGCSKEHDPAPIVANPENQYVNDWIQENMEYWYLWNDFLPDGIDRNLAPEEYFTALVYEDDRFSWIQENYQELLNSLNGINKEAGFEFVLYRESADAETVVAQILYVKPASPASNAGLKRGDLITRINGTTITTTNYRDLVNELKEPHTLLYKPLIVDENKFAAETTVTLSTLEYQENPNFLHTVIETGGKRIGYYVYNFFASGTDAQYDLEMDDIFNSFKSSQITDLILDLRFNSGGSEVSSKNLASLVGAGISSSNVFFTREYNSQVTNDILTSPSFGEKYLTSNFLDKTANVGNQLSGQRVYILTSSRTASASELIINALEPYMDVFLIGDVTYGKNVGSISIYEENDPKNKWGLQPIVTRVSNSEGFSDYAEGFQPDVLNEDNSFYIYPLGDQREALLAEALAQITGASSGGRIGAGMQSERHDIISHSLDSKRRGFVLIIDDKPLP